MSQEQRVAIKLTKEEAKELLASDRKFVQKRLHPDRFSLGLSFIVFIILFFVLYLYYDLFDQARIIPPFEPTFYQEVSKDPNIESVLSSKSPQEWSKAQLSTLDSIAISVLHTSDYRDNSRKRWHLLRGELLLLSGDYEYAISALQRAQSNFPEDSSFVNDILWLKGFIYYNQEEFAKSARAFHQLDERGSKHYGERALRYSKEVYALVEDVSFIEYLF